MPRESASWRSLVLVGFVSLLWWNFAERRLVSPEMIAASRLPSGVLAIGFAVTRLLGHLFETAVYFGTWRARGVAVRFLPILSGIAALSLIDLATMSLFPLARAASHAASPWAAWIAGPRANPALASALGAGALAAFGSCGLATLARLIGTAQVLRTAARVSARAAALVTAAAWLGSRLSLWWFVDLMRGRSPLAP